MNQHTSNLCFVQLSQLLITICLKFLSHIFLKLESSCCNYFVIINLHKLQKKIKIYFTMKYSVEYAGKYPLFHLFQELNTQEETK